jgi:DNA-binding NarL/FixJ family response regulator
MARPRVLIADEQALLLEAFEKLLADHCDIVGTVTDGRMLISAAAALKPDVAVVDVSMPLLNGIDAARKLKQIAPDIRIIILTMNEDPDVAAQAFRAGVSGYVVKRSAASELLTAIHEAMNHRSYVTPIVTGGLLNSLLRDTVGHDLPQSLTARQRGVIQLVAEGHSMKQIAEILKIAPRTVAFHKYRIMSQLNIKSTAELVRFAIKHHII